MNGKPGQAGARSARIATLSDQEALAIVDLIAGEFATTETPAGEKEQSAALAAAFAATGTAIDLSPSATADAAVAGRAARELLGIMAEVPEMQDALDIWLAVPPQQEALAVPLLIVVPAVFAGCIALLQVLGHSRFKRDSTGRWEFEYDAATKTSMDQTLPVVVKTMGDLVRPLTRRGGAG
ncbi:MAG: hypothetical protein BGP12_11835 [Rhodospirillales bacterium 70-18]|nr:hypothetical protein [Rhodospirillales bacterium]OJY68480.1 MAG: hypothetical protein BGP12_11835 [Rhodospirillales bacterium 70-18]